MASTSTPSEGYTSSYHRRVTSTDPYVPLAANYHLLEKLEALRRLETFSIGIQREKGITSPGTTNSDQPCG